MARVSRPVPRALTTKWPDAVSGDPAGETARRFAINLRNALGDRSFRSVPGVHHSTIQRILDGVVWPDMWTIAKLEEGVGARLWPNG